MIDTMYKQKGQCTYNVTVKRVHESFLPWKSNKYYLLVCVCVLACVNVDTRARGRVKARKCM
jgi:hypothetical protein